MNKWPGINDWLFAVKTFAASMLALYIALSIGLDRPYWAMATVYIVAQPLTGALRSKAVYRLLGTLVGATATIVLVPNLVNAPELLCAALALWIGFCLYLSLLDRTPRSYVFMLAGYTTAFIGFPSVTAPEQIWDIALSRVEEISLGIVCATVVASVVLPRPLGPMLSARILDWVHNASAWAENILIGTVTSEEVRNRLAADAVELRMLTTHLAYDTSKLQAITRWVIEVEQRMVLLLPLLSSIGDRMSALLAAGGVTPPLERLLSELRAWVRAGASPPRSEADRLRAEIARLEGETDLCRDWNEIMRASVLLRLRELVDVRQDLRDLRRHIETGGGALKTPLAFHSEAPALLYHDHGLASLSGVATAITILVTCTFWISGGWPDGGTAAAIAAVGCCFTAALDDPAPALVKFLSAAAISIVFVGIGLFGILPRVHAFETLTLALGAFFVPVGVLAAMPATQSFGTMLGLITATLLGLQSTYAADFTSYANSNIAALVGLGTAAVMMALVRSVGAEWSARRLLRSGWKELAAIPRTRTPRERAALAGLFLDRLGLLVPRLAAAGTGNELAAVDALVDLRIGVNMVDLQRARAVIPPLVRAAVDAVLSGAAAHFAAQAVERRALQPPAALLQAIDRALDAVTALPGPPARDLLLQLVGIRRGLFAAAPPYRPPAPPEDAMPSPATKEAA